MAEMCRKLDGIPLAIELAAGPVTALGLKNTVSRLVSRLELLETKPSDGSSQTSDPQGDLGLELRSVVRRRADRLSTHCSFRRPFSPWTARGMSPRPNSA